MGAFAHNGEYAKLVEDDAVLAVAGFYFCDVGSSRRSLFLPIAICCAKSQFTFVRLLQAHDSPSKRRGKPSQFCCVIPRLFS
jgi:hypothetical protein